MREISYAARGYPERAYAKWLALNFAWQNLQPLCRNRSQATVFREACERDAETIVNPLLSALDRVFVATLRFYRLKRGSGPTAIDVSTFFKRRNLDKEFAQFWRGSHNPARKGFKGAWARFARALDVELAR
jgi:hypothetical protein